MIVASFLLTFYEESPENANDPAYEAGATRSKYRKTKKALQRLTGDIQERNLICLLHGPGGSGKSTVIDAVKAYAVNTLDIHSLTGQSF